MCSFIVDILQFSLTLKYSGVRSDLSLEDDELVQHFSRSSQLPYTRVSDKAIPYLDSYTLVV